LTPSDKQVAAKNDSMDRDDKKKVAEPILMDSRALHTIMVWEPSLPLNDTRLLGWYRKP